MDQELCIGFVRLVPSVISFAIMMLFTAPAQAWRVERVNLSSEGEQTTGWFPSEYSSVMRTTVRILSMPTGGSLGSPTVTTRLNMITSGRPFTHFRASSRDDLDQGVEVFHEFGKLTKAG